MTARTIYNPETQQDFGWPRADDADVEGLQPPLVMLNVVKQDGPAVPDGYTINPIHVYDLENGQRIDTWELLVLPPNSTPEPEPRWVEFGVAIAADAQVNTMIATAAQSTPVLHLMLGVGLGQAAQGDSRTFLTAWSQALAVGLVSPALVIHVQELAGNYNLPLDFIEGLNSQ